MRASGRNTCLSHPCRVLRGHRAGVDPSLQRQKKLVHYVDNVVTPRGGDECIFSSVYDIERTASLSSNRAYPLYAMPLPSDRPGITVTSARHTAAARRRYKIPLRARRAAPVSLAAAGHRVDFGTVSLPDGRATGLPRRAPFRNERSTRRALHFNALKRLTRAQCCLHRV